MGRCASRLGSLAVFLGMGLLAPSGGLGQGFRLFYSFGGGGADGFYSFSQVVDGGDGYLYVTTTGGGDHQDGTVTRLDFSGNGSVLHSFDRNVDGRQPFATLIKSGGYFWGTTHVFGPGGTGYGTAFKMDSGGTVTTLHAFDFDIDPMEGNAPNSLFLASDGKFYGSTQAGGPFGGGTVFSMDTSGNVLYLFRFLDPNTDTAHGAYPDVPPVEGAPGSFYGTNRDYGANGRGVIYQVGAGPGTPVVLHDFEDATGYPGGPGDFGKLLYASDGHFYGTTFAGGAGGVNGHGTVFRMDAAGSYIVLHFFQDILEGLGPIAGLTEADPGVFYGTTGGGGAGAGGGIVFRIDAAGNYEKLGDLGEIGCQSPQAELALASDGRYYGTTFAGGAANLGCVFTMDLSITISDISPDSGAATATTLAPATVPFTITGTGFLPGSTVTIDLLPATGVSVPDSTHITATTPAGLTPGTLNDVRVTLPDSTIVSRYKGWFADFLDVPTGDIFHDYVRKLLSNGITAGCGGGNYCRNNPVTRAQMAVFLLKSEHGSSYIPPSCTGIFGDVPCPGQFADWIEQLSTEGITGGCGGGNYCPGNPVTRQQMAVFLLKTEHGSSYVPPGCGGIFGDVACPSQFADWIERLYAENVTGGCQVSPLLYCPANSVLRGQMAAFLSKTFNLQ